MSKLDQFIGFHRVMAINRTKYSEILTDDAELFCREIGKCGASVCEIVWWEYIKRSDQKGSIGGGGPIDAKNNEYMWSEIYYMSKKFTPDTTADELIEYIKCVRETYPTHDIHPAFDLNVDHVTE